MQCVVMNMLPIHELASVHLLIYANLCMHMNNAKMTCNCK